jgi:NTE family protein
MEPTEPAVSIPPAPTAKAGRHALCLSGGGYRAALFHLGVVTRLNEVGALGAVDTLSSVSGGSILAAHLVTAIPDWPAPGKRLDDWDTTVVAPFLAFTKTNIRTKAFFRQVFTWTRSDAGARMLGAEYQKGLSLGDRTIKQLPTHPRVILNCTDMQFGVDWSFDSGDGMASPARCGDSLAGFAALPDWPLGLAVAASSCFPPVFNPLFVGPQLHLTDGTYDSPTPPEPRPELRRRSLPPRGKPDGKTLRAQMELSDGGVYDNMGVEAVWNDHDLVIVSDGGGVFGPSKVRRLFPLQRYIGIANNDGSDVRRRWLLTRLKSDLQGAYLGISSSAEDYPMPPPVLYPRRLIEGYIATIRTDLNTFTDPEQGALMNHGYSLACAALDSHLPGLVAIPTPPTWPCEKYGTDVKALQRALQHSNHRKLF